MKNFLKILFVLLALKVEAQHYTRQQVKDVWQSRVMPSRANLDSTWDAVLFASDISSGITGTGTANYIPKWNTTSSMANSVLYNFGSNVGISTTSPQSTLQIGVLSPVQTLATPLNLSLGATRSNTAGLNPKLKVFDDGTNIYGFGASTGALEVQVPTSGITTYYINGVEKIRVDASGNIGINSASPAAKLDVAGTLKFSGAGTPGVNRVLTSDATGIATWVAPAAPTLTRVVVNASHYTDDGTHDYVVVTSASPAGAIIIDRQRTLDLTNTKVTVYTDERGDSGVNSITINAYNGGDGTETINGANFTLINSNYTSLTIYNVPSSTKSYIQ